MSVNAASLKGISTGAVQEEYVAIYSDNNHKEKTIKWIHFYFQCTKIGCQVVRIVRYNFRVPRRILFYFAAEGLQAIKFLGMIFSLGVVFLICVEFFCH